MRTRGPSFRLAQEGTARRQWRSSGGRKYYSTTADQRVYLKLPRELVSELFVYIGILIRLLKEVKGKLSQTIRILEHLEGDFREVLADLPTEPEEEQGVAEID